MNKQKGVALIVVLLIVALVSVIATDMATRLQLEVRKASNIKDNNQAYWYAMGAEEFARKAISLQLEQDKGVVNLDQPWAKTDFTYPLPGGGIEADLKDMQSCFNLNAIAPREESNNNNPNKANPTADVFRELLRSINIKMDELESDTLKGSLIDWLDSNDTLSEYGAEDSDYESLTHPYLPANSLMVNKSELRMVNGVSTKWINELMPYVCVIPQVRGLLINVNTIDKKQAPLLKAMLGNNISITDAQNILANRKPDGFAKIDDFYALSEVQNAKLTEDQKKWFDVTTKYFILHIKTRYNNASFRLSSMFKVDNQQVTVIRREFGGIL